MSDPKRIENHQPNAGVPEPEHGTRHGRKTGPWYAVLSAACLLAAYAADQASKAWVVATMVEGQKVPVFPPLLSWHFIRNPGAAFSIGTGHTWVFTIAAAVISVIIISQLRKVASAGWAVALGLVLAGALGNLTDRLIREPAFGSGHVVDFIALPNFAVFNIADSAVVSGVALICLLTLRGVGMDGRRSNESPLADPETSGEDGGEPDAGVSRP
jgi:signal peptidase II